MSATVHRVTCPLCEAMCGLQISVEAGGRVGAIRPDPDDPLSRGAICPKAVALRDLQDDPDRLRRPLKRRPDGTFTPIAWAQAFEEVADRLGAIRRRHGRSAVATYFGNPLVHNTGGILYGIVFSRALHTRSKFSATSLDQLPHMLAAWSMFGHQLLLPIPDVDRTRYLVIVGANPAVSNGSIMSAPGMKGRLRALRDRGGRVVVVDPRRTETARLADAHHFVRPGTDALWLFALAREIFEAIGPRLGRLEPHVKRLDVARELARPFTPEAVATPTGIPAAVTREVAERLVHTEEAVLYGRIGVCTQAFGGLCGWLVNLVNLIAGNLDSPGGAMFTTPAIDALQLASRLGRTGSFARSRTRVRGLPEFGGELPTATLAEEIETEGEDRIRALVTAAGNPVLSAPNGRRLEAALGKLDLMVAIDPYLNETTRQAHYVLPPVTPLERDHYDLVFHALAVRNTAKFSPAVLEPPPDARQDWQIFHELTHRLERKGGHPLQAALRRWVLGLGPRRLLDLGLRLGPHGLSLEKLRRRPSGMDLGPLEPRLPDRLFTPDRQIDAAPEVFVADVPRLRELLTASPRAAGLVLIGRRELRSNNSWMHNAPTLTKGRARCTLRMHPRDAKARRLEPGGRVQLRSRVGAIEAELEITEELMPGVVSLPHGYGHGRPGARLRVAEEVPGQSVNDVTDEQLIDALTGNAAFSGVPVEVEPLGQA
jgi:anaerobic selenocysteine-containing dehydrogenase